jgi:hypothetical protein
LHERDAMMHGRAESLRKTVDPFSDAQGNSSIGSESASESRHASKSSSPRIHAVQRMATALSDAHTAHRFLNLEELRYV